MATVLDILNRKGRDIVSVAPGTSVLEAATLMNQRGIGSVMVMEGPAVAGIFTERDVLRRVVAEHRDPATTPVSAVMTRDLVTCAPDTDLNSCGATMTSRRIRHLPVVSDQQLVGLVTSGDLMAHQVREQEATIQHLSSYVYDTR